MATPGGGGSGDVEAGFAKLQGEDFEYYMQTYSIVLGRNSKKSSVDVDLSSLGGGMNISRNHARIFYDFPRRRFALEVIGKNGCLVEGVLHLPGANPVKLDSQDLLQIGDKKFYFLLPTRSIFAPRVAPATRAVLPPTSSAHYIASANSSSGRLRPMVGYDNEEDDDDDDDVDDDDVDDGDEDEDDVGDGNGIEEHPPPMAMLGKRIRRDGYMEGYNTAYGITVAPPPGKSGSSRIMDKKGEPRTRVDREADNQQLLQLEEKDVVTTVATVLSDLCGPGDWMPMAKLHAELVEQYSGIWHHSRVRKYLTSEDCPPTEDKVRPWFGLLMLLRKYPEHFVINIRTKGKVTSEFVSLVSLLS